MGDRRDVDRAAQPEAQRLVKPDGGDVGRVGLQVVLATVPIPQERDGSRCSPVVDVKASEHALMTIGLDGSASVEPTGVRWPSPAARSAERHLLSWRSAAAAPSTLVSDDWSRLRARRSSTTDGP